MFSRFLVFLLFLINGSKMMNLTDAGQQHFTKDTKEW